MKWLATLVPTLLGLAVIGFVAFGWLPNRRYFADLDILAITFGFILSILVATTYTIYEQRQKLRSLATKDRAIADGQSGSEFPGSEKVVAVEAIGPGQVEPRLVEQGPLQVFIEPAVPYQPARSSAPVLHFDEVAYKVWIAGQEVRLTGKPKELLIFLLKNPHRLYSRIQLLEGVWGSSDDYTERTVDTNITLIRKALGDDASAPRFIENEPRAGYRFIGEVQIKQDTREAV